MGSTRHLVAQFFRVHCDTCPKQLAHPAEIPKSFCMHAAVLSRLKKFFLAHDTASHENATLDTLVASSAVHVPAAASVTVVATAALGQFTGFGGRVASPLQLLARVSQAA